MQLQALFSTTFFTSGDDGLKVSRHFWVYWVVTIPSTLLIIVIWRLWLQGRVQPLFESHPWEKLSERIYRAKLKEDGLVV
jgi:hypothetical protein